MQIKVTELRKNPFYAIYYNNWTRLLVLGIIPLAMLIYFNYKVRSYMSIARDSSRRDHIPGTKNDIFSAIEYKAPDKLVWIEARQIVPPVIRTQIKTERNPGRLIDFARRTKTPSVSISIHQPVVNSKGTTQQKKPISLHAGNFMKEKDQFSSFLPCMMGFPSSKSDQQSSINDRKNSKFDIYFTLQIYKDIQLRQSRRRRSMSRVTLNHQARRRQEDNLASQS